MQEGVLFDYISSASGILPVIAFIYNFGWLDRISRTIGAFFVIAAVFDVALQILPVLGVDNNMPAVHAFVIVNIVFFGVIYYEAFFIPKLKTLTIILISLALAIAVYFTRNLFLYPSEANTASSIVFIVLSLIYFYQLLNRQEFVHIEKQGLFWFNASVLFYFSINIFLFMLFNMIPKDDRSFYFIINNITNIIANLLYTTALLCRPQKLAS
ncbi:MAG TPA: hypothetical protein VG367_02580 [Mucilaginibacter sp.]|jgi:FtsH-binding integral membrane protein|nr:hypothetical protein [Mucilaginibacter sp.]